MLDAVELAVAAQRIPAALEARRQLLHQVDGAVLSSRATDGHGHVAAVVVGQRVQPVVQEVANVRQHQRYFGLLTQVVDDRRVLAREGAQERLEWGLGSMRTSNT